VRSSPGHDSGVVEESAGRSAVGLTQLITLGRACAVVPESLRAQLRDGHATVPVPDAPSVTTVIAWPSHSRSRAVADLVRTAIRR